MKVVALTVFSILLSYSTFAAPKKRCGKKYNEVLCNEVAGAKRVGFCWKGQINEEKKERYCKTAPKRKAKKAVKKG